MRQIKKPIIDGKLIFAITALLILSVVALLFHIRGYVSDNNFKDDEYTDRYDWDYLIFTQSWPVTTCLHWKEEDKNNRCFLANKTDMWTIHGIWPTKQETFGPSFCNKSAVFDINKLDPIADQMNMSWPNIETGTEFDSLWKHEWLKHGTCASNINALDDELKYFNAGLNWHSDFIMYDILGSAGILPGSYLSAERISDVVQKAIGVEPVVHCINKDKLTNLLAEIRICFDKSLKLTSCDKLLFLRHSEDNIYMPVTTNCGSNKIIYYPNDANIRELENK